MVLGVHVPLASAVSGVAHIAGRVIRRRRNPGAQVVTFLTPAVADSSLWGCHQAVWMFPILLCRLVARKRVGLPRRFCFLEEE